MILIACVDDNMGMAFNHRRQSRDRLLNDRILTVTQGHTLWMSPNTAKLFSDVPDRVTVSEHFLEEAAPGDYCFTEQHPVGGMEERIEGVVLYHWNRRYPADLYFDLNLSAYTKTRQTEFPGSSHETITEEIYTK